MIIVHVIGTASAAGAEILAKNLVLSFREKGHTSALWIMTRVRDLPMPTESALAYEAQFVAELEQGGVTVRFMDKPPRGGQIAIWRTLRKAFEADRPDIIHTHLESVSLHVALGLWGKRVKLVQTLHNVKVLFPALFRTVFRARFDAFVAISDKVGVALRQAGIPSRKITRIYNGIAPITPPADALPRQWPPKRCIAVGRLTPQKNHALLVDAFALLKEQIPEEQLPTVDIYGDGPLRDELHAQINALGLSRWINLKGVHADIPSLLFHYDLYLMTSSWEGLSLSLIEALHAGIPILATCAGSNNEIVAHGETGWLTPIDNPAEFCLQFNTIISKNKNTSTKENTAKMNIKEVMFTIINCSNLHINLYNKIKF